MPLASCPTCASPLRVPDGSTAPVRCPKCKAVFQPGVPTPPTPGADAPGSPKPRPAFGSGVQPPPVRVSPKPAAPTPPAPPKPASKVHTPSPPRPTPAVPPPPPPRPAPRANAFDPPKPPPPPPEPERNADFDFEIVAEEEPVKPKKAVPLDADRPKKARRLDDDEEDDRPRRKPARRRDDDDEEDDEDDRPRARGRSRDRDDRDDENDDRPRRKPARGGRKPARRRAGGGGGGPGRTAALLLAISLWTQFGALAAVAFFMLVMWAGLALPYVLLILPGLAGLGGWVVGLVGLSFAIAGPTRSRGLAIAAVCVAGVHLTLMFILATKSTDSVAGGTAYRAVAAAASAKKAVRLFERIGKGGQPDAAAIKEAEEAMQDVARDQERWSSSAVRWDLFVSLQEAFTGLPGGLIYQSKMIDQAAVGILAGGCEVARLVLILLLLRAMTKGGGTEASAGTGLVVAGVVVGADMVVSVLVYVLVHEVKWESPGTLLNLVSGIAILTSAAHAGMLFLPSVAAMTARDEVRTDGRRDDGDDW